jgi:hypothetical protein
MSIVEISMGIFSNDRKNSPKILAPPTWDIRNVSTYEILKCLYAIGSQSIMLNVFGISYTGFFPYFVSLMNLVLLLNILASQDTSFLQLKTTSTQPTLASSLIQSLSILFSSMVFLKNHL